MYLAIDIGGSKTLMAAFTHDGQLKKTFKFETPKRYGDFLEELKKSFDDNFGSLRFNAGCCAVPGELDRRLGRALVFGNLPWKNIPIKKDVQAACGHTPMLIENDAKLAGLAEALAHPKYKKVLYLTISTGVGGGIIVDGKIDPDFADSEPGQMMVEYEGKLKRWEDFASGRALFERYGKKASQIDDSSIWREYSKILAAGMNHLIAFFQPDAIIIGGGVGAHLEKFRPFLKNQIEWLENDMVETPPIIKAKHPEEAVIYGCYYLAKSTR